MNRARKGEEWRDKKRREKRRREECREEREEKRRSAERRAWASLGHRGQAIVYRQGLASLGVCASVIVTGVKVMTARNEVVRSGVNILGSG